MALLHLHRLIKTNADTEQRKQGMEEVIYEQAVSINSQHLMWVESNSGRVRVALSDGTIWIVKESPADIASMLNA